MQHHLAMSRVFYYYQLDGVYMKSFKMEKDIKDRALTLRLGGSIDEEMSLNDMDIDQYKTVFIDVGQIEFINSVGSREWVKWMKDLNTDIKLRFLNCPKIFIDQANMIEGFVPQHATIDSFSVPYFCEGCENLTFNTYQTTEIQGKVDRIPEFVDCEHCGKKAEIDVVPSTFFKFLRKIQGSP
jgi:hypothetical protein